MRKIIISVICVITLFVSCMEEAEYEFKTNIDFTMNNAYRVKSIVGHDDVFGDYQAEFVYTTNKLENYMIRNMEGDTVGMYEAVQHQNGSKTNTLYKYVIAVHPDSVANYHVDSIPLSRVRIHEVTIKNENGLVNEKTVKLYKFPSQQEIDDMDLNEGIYYYGTIKEKEIKYKYDYVDGTNNIFKYYELEVVDEDNVISVNQFSYDGNSVKSIDHMDYENGVWNKTNTLTFSYEGSNISKVLSSDNNELSYSYVYSNGLVSLNKKSNTEDTTIEYSINSEGYVTKIKYSENNYINITYEAGSGNYYMFGLDNEAVYGKPFVK